MSMCFDIKSLNIQISGSAITWFRKAASSYLEGFEFVTYWQTKVFGEGSKCILIRLDKILTPVVVCNFKKWSAVSGIILAILVQN